MHRSGVRPCTRYKKVKVQYYDEQMKIKIKTYTDFTAQIIQHEMDHLDGIVFLDKAYNVHNANAQKEEDNKSKKKKVK